MVDIGPSKLGEMTQFKFGGEGFIYVHGNGIFFSQPQGILKLYVNLHLSYNIIVESNS